MSTSGVSGSDTLNGTSSGEKLVGGGGSDTIDGGGGSDFINAGGGNDWIIYDEADYKILGGGGIDTLWFTGSKQKLNFGTQAINGIEALWLLGGGEHTVTFSAADVIRVSDTDRLTITGGTGSTLFIGSGWSFSGLTTDNKSQILTNGLASIVVQLPEFTDALPLFIDGFSNNASIAFADGAARSVTEDESNAPLTATLTRTGQLYVDDKTNANQGLLLPLLLDTELTGTGKLSTATTPPPDPSSLGRLTLTLITADTATKSGVYQYKYTVDNSKVQFLGKNPWIDSFTVKTIDGTTQTLEFTIAGANDAPSGPVTGVLANGTEDMPYTIKVGDLLKGFSDADGDALSVSEGMTATNGRLTNNNDGTYTFDPDADYNDTVILKYEVSDGNGGSIAATRSFDLDGADDPAKFTVTGALEVKEDTDAGTNFLTTTITIKVTDPDAGQSLLADNQTVVSGSFGSITRKSENVSENSYTYEYKVDNRLIAVQTLGANEFVTDSIKLNSKDGTTLTLEIKIWGAADPASGTPGNDVLYGTKGNDVLEGLAGGDSIFGGAGNDVLRGGGASDTISGGDGDDTIDGGTGVEFLAGEAGNDLLIFNARPEGNSRIWGGTGSDTFQMTNLSEQQGNSHPIIMDFNTNENDSIKLPLALSSYGFNSITWNGKSAVEITSFGGFVELIVVGTAALSLGINVTGA